MYPFQPTQNFAINGFFCSIIPCHFFIPFFSHAGGIFEAFPAAPLFAAQMVVLTPHAKHSGEPMRRCPPDGQESITSSAAFLPSGKNRQINS